MTTILERPVGEQGAYPGSIARPAPPQEGLTEDGEWARTADGPHARSGTDAYMSPEQWSGAPATERGDVVNVLRRDTSDHRRGAWQSLIEPGQR
jgi:hypothetical protein